MMQPPPLSAVIGLGLISAVLSLMLYPMGGTRYYYWYKHPLFIAGVVFMPLFAFVAAVLQSTLPVETKTWLLLVGMSLFWASALILVHSATHGPFIPGLKFRPDFILPGGVTFVKGIVLTGIGLMLTFQDPFKLPQWNWWGFVLAFWGIILIIPVRGMFKMYLRMHRLVGLPEGMSWRGVVLREGLLFLGLAVLLYGFLNAFMGTLSALPSQQRWQMMRRRLEVLRAMPEAQRRGNLRAMAKGISQLTSAQRERVMNTMVALLIALDEGRSWGYPTKQRGRLEHLVGRATPGRDGRHDRRRIAVADQGATPDDASDGCGNEWRMRPGDRPGTEWTPAPFPSICDLSQCFSDLLQRRQPTCRVL